MLFKLEREAERRVHEARDRETDRGGSGSGRRASEAMDAPMLEVAAIRKMRQRFGDLQMAIDHHSNLLRKTKRNPDLPPDVTRHRIVEAETRLAGLAADYKDLEAEAAQKFLPAPARVDADGPTRAVGDRRQQDTDETNAQHAKPAEGIPLLDGGSAATGNRNSTSASSGFTFIGPGGEGQPNERPGKRTPSVADVGPPSYEPVNPEIMYGKFGFDPDGPGEVARTIEHPLKAWKANQIFKEAVAVTSREAANGSFVMGSPESNAFTHAYGSYRMTQELGPFLAKQFGDSHEITVVNPVGQRLKDLYNNNAGRRLALDPDNQGRYAEHVALDALRDGKLQILPFRLQSPASQGKAKR